MRKIFFISALALSALLIGMTDTRAQNSSRKAKYKDGNITVSARWKNDSGWNKRRVTLTPSKRIVTREVDVRGNINEIDLHGIADVEYRQSRNGRTRVEVSGNENLLEYLEVYDSRGVLNIGWEQKAQIKGKFTLKVIVSSPNMNRLSATGAGDIRILGQLESNELEITSRGASDIKFDRINAGRVKIETSGAGDVEGNAIDTKRLSVSVSGASDVDVSRVNAVDVEIAISGSGDVEIGSGQARNAMYRLSGSADLDAYGLRTENLSASVSGSGDIVCYATSSLRAETSGVGTITVGGKPDKVDIRGKDKSVRFR